MSLREGYGSTTRSDTMYFVVTDEQQVKQEDTWDNKELV